jgi:hypothetical protein
MEVSDQAATPLGVSREMIFFFAASAPCTG